MDDLELRVLEYVLDRDMPVLAICRGMQLLNVAFGGKLIQDLPDHKAQNNRWGLGVRVPPNIYRTGRQGRGCDWNGRLL